MGSTLTTSWVSGRDEGIADTEDIQYSKYPFHTGLANINKSNGSEDIGSGEIPEAGSVLYFWIIMIATNNV